MEMTSVGAGIGMANIQMIPENNSAEIKDQLLRESRPMKMTDMMINRPCLCLSIGFIFLIIWSTAVTMAELATLDPGGERDYLILDDKIVVDMARYSLTQDAYADTLATDNQVGERSLYKDAYLIVYENS